MPTHNRRHHQRFAPDPKNTGPFAGYQAEGTRRAAIMAGARAIRVDDQNVSVTLGWLQMDAPEPIFITQANPAPHLITITAPFLAPCGAVHRSWVHPHNGLPPDAGFEPVLFFPIWRGTSVRST